jgi:transketolase
MPDSTTLHAIAQKLRRDSILSTSEAGSGHPTTCMSAADIAAVLFFDEMRWDPRDPHARNQDMFVLSKGHAAPLLWAALTEAGAVKESVLTLRKKESPLEGHPTPLIPWVKVATGSLGQGLSAALGMALGKRLDGIDARVYCLLGDGEMAEGSVWEAAELAAHDRVENLCAIVDANALGQSGPSLHGKDASEWVVKLQAFGWHAFEVDGHNIDDLKNAFADARNTKGRPTAIVARTEKGHGVSFVVGKPGWHGRPFKKGEEEERALAEVGDPQVTASVEPRHTGPAPRPPAEFALDDPALAPDYKAGAEVATREAYGTALAKLGKVLPDVVALDGDTKNSTFSERFKDVFPARFFDAFIAEQNMVGMALGLAAEGKVPFASTFAAFYTRAYDFVRMAAYSKPRHLVLTGSHCGVSIGEDGASQMALEDLAMMRPIFGASVLYPCDAVSTERLVAQAAAAHGIVYLRTSRPKAKILYPMTEMFPIGGSKTLRKSARDAATVVAAGVTVHEALKAADILAKEGTEIRVIDLYSVKPLDVATLRAAARETGHVITVEDHAAEGGIGEAVAAALGAPVTILAVRKMPRSATPTELLAMEEIDAAAIVAAVKRGN